MSRKAIEARKPVEREAVTAIRLDKFLKISRIIKRRSVANDACSTGHVTVNGKEAKALYQNKKYDVIITDIIMPDVDGYEVILDLRRLGMSDRTIAVSGGGRTSAEDYLMTAQHFDAAATFNKPVDLQALRAKVEEIIKNHS